MAKYKVKYSGFVYIEADSPEEAIELYEEDYVYDERHVGDVEEVDEFNIGIEGW